MNRNNLFLKNSQTLIIFTTLWEKTYLDIYVNLQLYIHKKLRHTLSIHRLHKLLQFYFHCRLQQDGLQHILKPINRSIKGRDCTHLCFTYFRRLFIAVASFVGQWTLSGLAYSKLTQSHALGAVNYSTSARKLNNFWQIRIVLFHQSGDDFWAEFYASFTTRMKIHSY